MGELPDGGTAPLRSEIFPQGVQLIKAFVALPLTARGEVLALANKLALEPGVTGPADFALSTDRLFAKCRIARELSQKLVADSSRIMERCARA